MRSMILHVHPCQPVQTGQKAGQPGYSMVIALTGCLFRVHSCIDPS